MLTTDAPWNCDWKFHQCKFPRIFHASKISRNFTSLKDAHTGRFIHYLVAVRCAVLFPHLTGSVQNSRTPQWFNVLPNMSCWKSQRAAVVRSGDNLGLKVKSAIYHRGEQDSLGVYKPFSLSMWRMQRQTHGYLPSRRVSLPCDRYLCVAWWQRHVCVWTTCPRSLPDSGTAERWTRQSNALTISPPGHIPVLGIWKDDDNPSWSRPPDSF